jgi:type IV pilus assembly protein PilY1
MHSLTHLLRRVGLGLAVLAMMATGAHAELGDSADNTVACCQLTTSLVNDVLRGRDVSGDEKFFSAEGAPPNIFFLLDTSGSMQELPQVINSKHTEFFSITQNGCENPRLDAYALARGWDPNHVYPVPDQGTGLGADMGFPNLFQDSKYYGWYTWASSSNPTPGWSGGTKETACNAQVPGGATGNPPEYTRCLTCLSTKGYYKVPGTNGRDSAPQTSFNFIFWGRYLNFNPPKYVTARAVLKSVIKDLRRVRAGLAHFTNTSTSTLRDRGQNPTCTQIINDASSFDSNRASYINDINGLVFNTGTPLGRSLLNIGYYFTSDDGVFRDDNMFGFGGGYSYPSGFKNATLTSGNRSVCWGCQVSSAIVITDGEPTSDAPSATVREKIRAKNGGPVYCPDSNPCGVGSDDGPDKGINNDPNDPARFDDDNNDYYLDDVAKLLYEQDLQRNTPPVVGDFNTAGKQNLITYTVGFGINSPFLQHTADVGGGLYYYAYDADALKQALLEIIANVQTRATSFSSPAASTLQVRSASATLLPRFKPARSRTAPWQGFLYRFDMGPELLLGCNPSNPDAGNDLNDDGDCDDTLLIDADGEAVIENDNGDFVKLLSPLTPAVPFWEAGSLMRPPGNNTTHWQTRRIWTIVDNAAPFGTLDYRDTPVEFTEANAGVLREYLGISQNPTGCDDLALQLGEPLTPDQCARLIIRWYRGADALNPDPSLRGYDRPFLLHDIFHSSPANVDPPIPRDFCDFSLQCVQTLFSGSTVMDNTYSLPGGRTNVQAYDKYEYEAGNRDKIVLVGSNGGMLHALLNGQTDNEVDHFTRQRKYDNGTGEELWAFIPPDLLPKLRPNINKHGYFVDATPMVRDVWIDGAANQPGDGKKQWQEYRTVAVIGTGRGGVHRFALDLTRVLGLEPGDAENLVPDHAGDFLWMWPQPCDPLSLQVGESFSNFAPRPPPILPVALSPQADDALRDLYGPATGSPETPHLIEGAPARERYVVFLNGGYDPSMTRGRGMAIVDIKSGHTLWSFFHGDGSTRSDKLRYPIAAGISVMDYGRADSPHGGDYLSDTGTVGDYGGQLWTLRFWKPGTWDSSRKRVDNWYAARAFRVANLGGQTTDPEALRAPITYMTLNTQQQDNGFVRSFVGTGDRENLMDKGTICRLSNPRACAVQGFDVNNTLTVRRGGSTTFVGGANYSNYRYASGPALTGTAGNACASAQVSLSWVTDATTGCNNPGDCKIEYTCDGDTSSWSCRETDNDWAVLNYTMPTAPYPQRYYGVWVYGGVDPARHFNTDAEANLYDSRMFTDADLVNVSQFDASGNVITASQVSAAPSGKGWYIQYGQSNERTGSTGTIVNGCVLWNSFEPSGVTGAVCSTTGTNIGRLYQASFATGVANCAVSFYDPGANQWARFQQRSLVAAPPEPMRQVAIGPNFLISGVALQGAGITDKADVSQDDTSSRSLYQLELDRRGHDCRHNPNLSALEREEACKPL